MKISAAILVLVLSIAFVYFAFLASDAADHAHVLTSEAYSTNMEVWWEVDEYDSSVTISASTKLDHYGKPLQCSHGGCLTPTIKISERVNIPLDSSEEEVRGTMRRINALLKAKLIAYVKENGHKKR